MDSLHFRRAVIADLKGNSGIEGCGSALMKRELLIRPIAGHGKIFREHS